MSGNDYTLAFSLLDLSLAFSICCLHPGLPFSTHCSSAFLGSPAKVQYYMFFLNTKSYLSSCLSETDLGLSRNTSCALPCHKLWEIKTLQADWDELLFISCCRILGWLAFSEVVCPEPSGALWWQQWHGRCMNRWWKKWAWSPDWAAWERTSFTPPVCCDQLALRSSQFHRGISLPQPGGRKAFWHRGLGLLASRGKEGLDLCVVWSMHSRRTALADCHGKWQGFHNLVTMLRSLF